MNSKYFRLETVGVILCSVIMGIANMVIILQSIEAVLNNTVWNRQRIFVFILILDSSGYESNHSYNSSHGMQHKGSSNDYMFQERNCFFKGKQISYIIKNEGYGRFLQWI